MLGRPPHLRNSSFTSLLNFSLFSLFFSKLVFLVFYFALSLYLSLLLYSLPSTLLFPMLLFNIIFLLLLPSSKLFLSFCWCFLGPSLSSPMQWSLFKYSGGLFSNETFYADFYSINIFLFF